MTLYHLDSAALKKLVLAGSQHVINNQDFLNQINVFPVPDGDTGSNMAAAFESIEQELQRIPKETPITKLCQQIADAALNGSRGNSGTILAQFFQGFYEGIGEHEKIGLEKFAEAAQAAALAAHDAITNPVEGTIITIMRDWAEWTNQYWSRANNLAELFEESLGAAENSLNHTPDQLKILSTNHVVDAGAQGFYYFLEGATNYLTTGKMPELNFSEAEEGSTVTPEQAPHSSPNFQLHLAPHANHQGDLEHQYCTECIIHGDNLDLNQVKQKLSRWGSSFVVIGGKHKIKVHIHTNAPAKVFRDANLFGELLETKADDMWAQYRAKINFNLNKQIALITDSSCNLPQEIIVKYNIMIIPLQLIINNQTYLDRVTLSSEDFVNKLTDSSNTITTSQPAVIDIKAILDKALNQSSTVLGVFLSDKLSGTFRSISHTAKQYDDAIYLYDSRNASGGLGLIVQEAAKSIHKGIDLPTVKKQLAENIAYTASFVAFSTLDYAIRGGRVKKMSGIIAKLLNLLPVLKLDSKGKPQKVGIGFGKALARKKMLNKAWKYAKSFKDQELIITHVNCLKTAEKAQKWLSAKFPDKSIYITETTPILATHAGPGALCVSVLGKVIS